MTVRELARAVADEINKVIVDEGFKDFKEMKECYWWDAADIRDEISYIANEIANENLDSHIIVMDDGAVEGIHEGCDYKYVEYRDFKKMVLSLVM